MNSFSFVMSGQTLQMQKEVLLLLWVLSYQHDTFFVVFECEWGHLKKKEKRGSIWRTSGEWVMWKGKSAYHLSLLLWGGCCGPDHSSLGLKISITPSGLYMPQMPTCNHWGSCSCCGHLSSGWLKRHVHAPGQGGQRDGSYPGPATPGIWVQWLLYALLTYEGDSSSW